MGRKRGQVWVETVVYLLVALLIIGGVLSFVRPKIQEIQDKIVINQMKEKLEEIDSTIKVLLQEPPGNKRKILMSMKKGQMTIDGANNKIIYEITSKHQYSENGQQFQEGNLFVTTTKKADEFAIEMMLDYSNDDLRYNSGDDSKKLTASSATYEIFLSNERVGGLRIINLEI